MARVVSTAAAYQRLADASKHGSGRAAWMRRYEAQHPSIFESYYSSWGDVDGRDSAAARVPELALTVPGLESRARDLLERAELALRSHGVLDDEASAVLLVGVGSSNGWVAQWEGEPTLFLALEMLPDPPYDEVLVVHEMTHLAHQRRLPPPWPETVGTRVFSEGLAGAVSRQAVPGHRLDGYLWFDDTHRSWLDDCQARGDQLGSLVRADLGLDEALGARYFSARSDRAGGLPVRSGYWVGLLAVDRLLDEQPDRSPRRLLEWDAGTATAQLAPAVSQLWPSS